jgi:hypothetical protein
MRSRFLGIAVALARVFATQQAIAKSSTKAAAASKKHHQKHHKNHVKHIRTSWADPEVM